MMSTGSVSTGPGECIRMLDELERLLNEQTAMVRKRNFDTFEELVEKSGGVVDELGRLGVCETPELKERLERLVKSYRTVVLSATAEKDSLEKQLKQISQGRKTLRTYRGP